MLVIRRRVGEILLIGDNIAIEILDMGPAHVKLGIRAPREIPVMRHEVLLTRQQNQEAASSAASGKLERILGSFSLLRTISSSRE